MLDDHVSLEVDLDDVAFLDPRHHRADGVDMLVLVERASHLVADIQAGFSLDVIGIDLCGRDNPGKQGPYFLDFEHLSFGITCLACFLPSVSTSHTRSNG